MECTLLERQVHAMATRQDHISCLAVKFDTNDDDDDDDDDGGCCCC